MSNKRALLYGLLCWASYLGGRTLLQRLIPFNNWSGYVVQDLAITVLRLACGLACLWIARRRWYDSALGISHTSSLSGLLWLSMLVLFGAELMEAAAQQRNWNEAHWIRAVEVAVALVVAFNEEVGYRLLAYGGLREPWGRRAAIVLSTCLFTLMHYGYQPLFHLPKIFFVGLCFAILRDRGASLKSLIVLHFLIDSIFAVTLSGDVTSMTLYHASSFVAALAACIAWLEPGRFAASGECLLFVYGSLKPGSPEARELGVEKLCDLAGSASAQGRLAERGGYPVMKPTKKAGERVSGLLLRLRDHEFLSKLDAYEGENYLRDKTTVKMEKGENCETWIYFSSK